MKIYFVRHGQTDYNRQRKFYGTTDVPINKTGKSQCQTVGRKLHRHSISKVYTSSRLRAMQSAQLIFPDHSFIARSFLDEWGFGLWEGLDADEIQAAFPLEWDRWLKDPFGYTPPGAKPYSQFVKVMIAGFEQLLLQEEDIALVTHLGTIRVLLHYIYPEISFWDIALSQENYTCISYDGTSFEKIVWDN
ncbi:MAG TPA: histidine phosphatase family protein [Tetragenococcus sp.]|nr:histidine phosphatase family protein [Tetragenococcus sp.]